jgi:nucleotide-binding universal stress UspA family protein
MYKHVLLPTDGSEGTDAVVENAREIANRFDAEVHVLHVVDQRLSRLAQEYRDLGSDVGQTATDELGEVGQEAVSAVTSQLSDDISVTEAVVEGVPHEAILEYAADEDIDLIVMGTHGRTGLSRSLLGSVTERVVRSADVPVLTVRAE